jgi:hypothetical protein
MCIYMHVFVYCVRADLSLTPALTPIPPITTAGHRFRAAQERSIKEELVLSKAQAAMHAVQFQPGPGGEGEGEGMTADYSDYAGAGDAERGGPESEARARARERERERDGERVEVQAVRGRGGKGGEVGKMRGSPSSPSHTHTVNVGNRESSWDPRDRDSDARASTVEV